MATKDVKDNAQYKDKLTDLQYNVTREAGTEPAFTGIYWDEHGSGVYRCVCCDAALFTSAHKYDSGTGWPSFFQPVDGAEITEKVDNSFGMMRTEVLCGSCNAHLGHLFPDGPAPTGMRYCLNSASLRLEKGEAGD